MPIDLSGLLQLSQDVLIIPVADLPEESRQQIDFDPGDFAISRMQSRSGSKIVGAEAADVLARFREPRTIVEAVILFGRDKKIDPDTVLRDAYPFLQSMVEAGFLVRAADRAGESEGGAPERSKWGAGTLVLGARIERTYQVFDDTEVFLLARPDGSHSVLKIERRTEEGRPVGSARQRIEHEARVLQGLRGAIAPRVLGVDEVDSRRCIELEFIAGLDATSAASEWRERESADARARLLALARSIAQAYVALHAHGVVHGDVHPRNVLVLADHGVRLIDFGMAVLDQPAGAAVPGAERGGVPFFFEPELARAYLDGLPAPAASAAGEQHAVAALIYHLVTGAYWQDFRLGRAAMLEDIASREPLSFADRGVRPWPALEAVLRRALAKSPAGRFASMAEFAGALERVTPPAAAARPARPNADPARLVDEALAQAGLAGRWYQKVLEPAPATSINYGSAGISLGLLHIAQRRGDAEVLALADLWSMRALHELGDAGAYYNADIQITPELVGQSSPYHSPSGVFAVAALVATAKGDAIAAAAALSGFIDAAQRPRVGLDLTLGQSSVVLGAAILLDALLASPQIDCATLREFGDHAMGALWQALDAKPPIAEADIEYLGIAHGWAGMLYASLQWCRVSGSAVPTSLGRRLDELAALALPTGRGLEWPWILGRPGEPMTMAGWCNGTCGYVFLWTLARSMFDRPRYLDLARGAALRSWDVEESSETLCCGVAGRGYALLNMYRSTQERVWTDRARDLVRRAIQVAADPADYAHSLYKGKFGLAVLAAELDHPDDARAPFFEPFDYSR